MDLHWPIQTEDSWRSWADKKPSVTNPRVPHSACLGRRVKGRASISKIKRAFLRHLGAEILSMLRQASSLGVLLLPFISSTKINISCGALLKVAAWCTRLDHTE